MISFLNQGQAANLPLGAVVETNAVFRRDAVIPMMAGSLPQYPQMGNVPLKDGIKLFDDMLKATSKYLPREWNL